MNYGNTPLRAILKTAASAGFSVSAGGSEGRMMSAPSRAPSERPSVDAGFRSQAPVALSRALDVRVPPAAVAPAAVAPPKPSDLALASLARQIARQSNFRPVGLGDFTEEAAAQRFMSRNPRFTALARKRLSGG